ncbi:cchl, partial [Symbiodinium sp. KB8]
EEGNWVYPSPQMFYNAMKRKGYEAKEEDMSNIVAIHNAVNERTWMEIMKWEQHHFKTCPQPKLQRFRGRPNDLSVKAQWRTMTGAQPPFDRHDWVVDRCGTEVRYIIDYYTGKAPRETVAPSFFLDVRPALDRPGAFLERGAQLFRDAWSNVKKMWSV